MNAFDLIANRFEVDSVKCSDTSVRYASFPYVISAPLISPNSLSSSDHDSLSAAVRSVKNADNVRYVEKPSQSASSQSVPTAQSTARSNTLSYLSSANSLASSTNLFSESHSHQHPLPKIMYGYIAMRPHSLGISG